MIRFLLILTVFIAACNQQDAVPRGILPPDKMENVLWDVLQADEAVNYLASREANINRFDSSLKLYNAAFDKHKTNADQFKKSMNYYQQHPKRLKVLLDSLEKHASKRIIQAGSQYNHPSN